MQRAKIPPHLGTLNRFSIPSYRIDIAMSPPKVRGNISPLCQFELKIASWLLHAMSRSASFSSEVSLHRISIRYYTHNSCIWNYSSCKFFSSPKNMVVKINNINVYFWESLSRLDYNILFYGISHDIYQQKIEFESLKKGLWFVIRYEFFKQFH